MQPSTSLRAVHKPLIQFIGSRANLWKDAPHHIGPHALTPPNLVKHVVEAPKSTTPVSTTTPVNTSNSTLEFSQLPSRYRRAPISEAEMEAIESGGATHLF